MQVSCGSEKGFESLRRGGFLSGVSILHVLSAVCEVSCRDGHSHVLKHGPTPAILGGPVVAGCKCLAGPKNGLKASGVEDS